MDSVARVLSEIVVTGKQNVHVIFMFRLNGFRLKTIPGGWSRGQGGPSIDRFSVKTFPGGWSRGQGGSSIDRFSGNGEQGVSKSSKEGSP